MVSHQAQDKRAPVLGSSVLSSVGDSSHPSTDKVSASKRRLWGQDCKGVSRRRRERGRSLGSGNKVRESEACRDALVQASLYRACQAILK